MTKKKRAKIEPKNTKPVATPIPKTYAQDLAGLLKKLDEQYTPTVPVEKWFKYTGTAMAGSDAYWADPKGSDR